MNCYYVISIKMPRVVTEVDQDFLSYIIKYGNLITLGSFAQCDTLKEARKIRKEVGGIILKGIR